MYVSMNPSGETGKAIHISQDDTNREVEFIPYDQNGLVKTTSDETVAHINSIKGNTVKFNQLVQNGNFADTTGWSAVRGNISASSNVLTYAITEVGSADVANRIVVYPTKLTNHKYFVRFGVLPKTTNKMVVCSAGETNKVETSNAVANQWNTLSVIWNRADTTYNDMWICFNCTSGYSTNDTIKVQNVNVFDLTLMGIDNLTTVVEVEEWLSSHIGNHPYFDYTQGTLIPFSGTGLKTTGKNLCDNSTIEIGWYDGVGNHNLDSTYKTSALIPVLPNTTYIATLFDSSKTEIGRLVYTEWDGNGNVLSQITSATITTSSKTAYIRIRNFANQTSYVTSDNFLYQLEIGSTATEYEPYTSNTLSLPTLTYFPTGMKSAGSVYDELSDKAYTRVGKIDNLGDITSWTLGGGGAFFDCEVISDIKSQTANILSSKYETGTSSYFENNPTIIGFAISGSQKIRFYNSGLTTVQAVIDALQGVSLYYEKTIPTSTDISLDLTYPVWNGGTEQILPINDSTPDTAPIKANITYPDRTEDTEFLYKQTSFVFIPRTWAFVCKNITQVLALVGDVLKGTIPSGMTSESGKFPLKLKMTDEDGDVYSEKIDLFVERKP